MTNQINTKEDSKLFRVLAYGIERLDYQAPSEKIINNNIEITFAPFDTELKFQDFNGVILFQGIWGKLKKARTYLYGLEESKYQISDSQENMLNVRLKQLQTLLFEKNGFIAFLMNQMDKKDLDLAKTVLTWFPDTYFEPINDTPYVRKVYFNELYNYLQGDYGVSKTKFYHFGNDNYRTIADIENYQNDISICLDNRIFYLPCHIIRKDEKSMTDLFKTLTPALIATFKKLNQEIPKWTDEFKLFTENKLLDEKIKLENTLEKINDKLITLIDFKKPLILANKPLVESVVGLMKNGIGIDIKSEDKGYEDIQLYDLSDQEKPKIIAVIEIKGLNDNIKRDSINQVDDHRERNGYNSDFPGIIIANTFIKNSNSIKDKDKPIEEEQIKHAVKMNVLILRTLDLLRAYNLILEGKITVKNFQNELITKIGWLEVKDNIIKIHN